MENFKYQDESDMPRDTYIGLKMQIGLTEKSIRYTKINLNKARYSYEKKRYEKRLEYLTNLLNIYKDELNKFDKNEGIHLVAYVKDKQTGEATTIEDNDYNSKQDFENDLKANGYNNISILDNRDLYLSDNTNYTRVSQLKKDLQQLKKDIDDAKDKYPALYKSYVKEYDRLKTIYDNVMKIPLTEGYVLKGIQDGKSFDISYNDSEEKLQKFKDEMQPKHQDIDMYIVKENKSIKTKAVDITKLPSLEYELESRSENLDYRKIYNKVKKSKSGKIRCTYNELDLISAIYLDNDNYDYDKLNIQNIVYESKQIKNKEKLEEVSRNELLVKTKGETVDRYNKAAGYRGFSIYNIDTSNILRYNSLVVICRVGKYNTAVELEEILYWIQIVAENTKSYTKNQINTKVVTQAIMNSIDGLNIRVDCECGDWKYRMAYQATQWGYKYGTPENRPANIRNPEGRGALCFDGNTLILTDNGYIPIKDIKVGDMVFTHKGQLKKVIETSNHDANNVVDVTIGNKHIICTDNHPFYTSNSHYRDIKFVSLNNIKHTWKVLSPILVLNDNIDINCDFAFILGYYLANGTIGYRTDYLPKKILCSNIRLCVSSDYKDIIAKCLNKIGIEYNYIENDKDKSSYYRLKVSNDAGKELYNFIIKYGNFNYKDEQSKKLNKEILSWSNESKIALIKGFFAGDGQYGSNGKYLNMRFLNTNKNIIEILNILLRSLGIHTKIIKFKRKPRKIANNSNISDAKDMYCITVCGQDILKIDDEMFRNIKGTKSYNYPISHYKSIIVTDDTNTKYFTSGIKNITYLNETRKVYNIGVQDDDSYLVTTDMFAVHNCKHLTSILGNKRWLQQVTSTLLNWLEANIDEVNRFLGLSGDRVLTLPNELARQNAKLSWQNRQKGDKNDDTTNQENAENIENQDNNTNNVQGNNPSTNTINNTSDIEEQTDETEQEDNEE